MSTRPSALSLEPQDWAAREGHVPSLDGMRAVSILIVLIGHMVLPASLIGVSAFGVKIFFFISGFLITRLLLAENKSTGRVSLPDFYIRRFLRLYPVLIVYMVLVVAITLLRGQSFDPLEVFSVFFYFVNYLLVQHELAVEALTLPIGVLWSLSVEEHFYLFAPLALVLVRGDARRMLMLAIGICVVSLALRLLYAQLNPGIVDTLLIYKHSETRFDSIAFGVILACLSDMPKGRALIARLATPGAMIAGIVLLLATFAWRNNYYESTWRFTLQGLLLFPIVIGLVFAQPIPLFNRMMNFPVAVWIGRLSYSLYVWHGGVAFLFGWWLEGQSRPVMVTAELVATVVLAVLSFYCVEKPVLRLRKHFHHRAKAGTATMASTKPEAAQAGLR